MLDDNKQIIIDLPRQPDPRPDNCVGSWYYVSMGSLLVLTFRCPGCDKERSLLPSSLSTLSTFTLSCTCGLHRTCRLVDYLPLKLSS